MLMDLPGNSQPRAGRSPPDPGGGRDPYRGLPERVQRMVGRVLTRARERMLGAAEYVRNSMLGSGQRTNRDEILITNRSEAAV